MNIDVVTIAADLIGKTSTLQIVIEGEDIVPHDSAGFPDPIRDPVSTRYALPKAAGRNSASASR
jgi:hypothetical protein